MTLPIPLDDIQAVPAQAIMELASGIQPPKQILDRWLIPVTVFKEVLSKDPQFINAFREAKQFWNSDSNAKERITIKAQAMLEDSLLAVHELFHNAATNPTARMDALKTMMKLARMDAGEAKEEIGPAAGKSVHVHINMAPGVAIIKDVTPIIEGITENE
jgi:hypothetical protein